jgi:murein DD-endopeptidase MepM/ murein hydrolase activator NlpD
MRAPHCLALTLILARCADPAPGETGAATPGSSSGTASSEPPGTTADVSGGTSTGTGTSTGSSSGPTTGASSEASSAASTSPDTTAADASTSTDGSESSGGPAASLPWTYIAALDQGIRDDDGGGGAFQAPRFGYLHSGIDFHMPVGTPLYSPCDGVYLADYDGGYGNWVQVICALPAEVAGEASVHASLLFAHLETSAVAVTGIDPNAAGAVTRGQLLGSSGKTGNAAAPEILPHLHFEVAIHDTELAALGEAHISGDDGDTPAAATLREAMATNCLAPTGLKSLHATLGLGRRIDPFMLLSCLVGDKPGLQAPADQALHAWSEEYVASSFEVDVGQTAP